MMIATMALTTTQAKKFDPSVWEAELAVETKKLSDAYTESVKMCKICAKKALEHQETMKGDPESLRQLEEYQRKLSKYCGPLTSAETKMDKERAAEVIKEEEAKAKAKATK